MEPRIDFVCDGAVVDTHPLEWSSSTFKLGICLIAPVGYSELDLSHFKVRNKTALARNLAHQALEPLKEMLHLLLDQVGSLDFTLAPRPDSRAGVVGSGLARGVLALQPIFRFGMRASIKYELETILRSLQDPS
jgi:hypothetical protein